MDIISAFVETLQGELRDFEGKQINEGTKTAIKQTIQVVLERFMIENNITLFKKPDVEVYNREEDPTALGIVWLDPDNHTPFDFVEEWRLEREDNDKS